MTVLITLLFFIFSHMCNIYIYFIYICIYTHIYLASGFKTLLMVWGKMIPFQVPHFLWYVWIVAWFSTAKQLWGEPKAWCVHVTPPKEKRRRVGLEALKEDLCSLSRCRMMLRCQWTAVKVVANGEHLSKNIKALGVNRSTSLGRGHCGGICPSRVSTRWLNALGERYCSILPQ